MALPARGQIPLSVVVRRYVSHRRQIDRLAPSTVSGYMIVLVNFSDVVGPVEVGRLQPRHATRYVREKTKGGLSTAALATYLSRLKQFAAWLVAEKYTVANFMAAAHHPRRPRSSPRGLTPAEVLAVLGACETPRERILCALMREAGLRCIEASRLQRCDVDLEAKMLLVHGKGNHERELPITSRLERELHRYLDGDPIPSSAYMVRSVRDDLTQLSAEAISDIVGEIFRRAKVKRARYDGRGAHAWRHTLANDLLDNGVDVRDVGEILGHAHPSTTWNVYGRRNRSTTRLREALESREGT